MLTLPEITNRDSEPYLAIRETVTGAFESAVDRAFGELFGWLDTEGVAPAGPAFICHTVEVWDETELIGGLYGLALGAAFFGESMFHRRTDASKIAMANLLRRLAAGRFQFVDTQFITDHLRTFGAVEIPREDYEVRLAEALRHRGDFFAIDR